MTATAWKQRVVEELEMLASEEQQLAYEANVPDVDITAELISGWFDDTYHPDAPEFCACFTAEELKALKRFSKFYDERREHLPRSKGTVRTWLGNPLWRQVMDEAAQTRSRIGA